jgi:uncharacterized protein (TIGR01777 family)
MKKQLLIAGGTGLIGSAICKEAVKQGWEVVILSRRSLPGGISWNPEKSEIDISSPRSFDAIINLAGSSIAGGRWTTARIKEIHDSRVNACNTIEKYLAKGLLQTQVYIGSSAIGIYGDHGQNVIDEKSHLGEDSDWMVSTGKAWEEAHFRIATLGIRTIILRTGIVLSQQGGALKEILMTAPLGIIGYFGNGKQFWSWIHMDDLVAIIFKAITDEKMSGLYLAAAPEGVTNKDVSHAVGRALHPKRLVIPVPVFLLMVLLGKMRRMLLQSCKGYPTRLLAEGFSFRYPMVKEALKDLIGSEKFKL